MKKRTAMYLMTVILVLTACNNNEQSKEQSKEAKTEVKTKTQKTSESKTSTTDKQQEKKQEAVTDVSKLSEETKLALAFFGDGADKYTLTPLEALNGIYTYKAMSGDETKLVPDVIFAKTEVANAPEGMNFYAVRPSKGNFETIIGASDKELYVGGTQGALDYNEIKKTGNTYQLKDIYEKNKDYTSLPELAKKIKVVENDPMHDEQAREEFLAKQEPTTQARMRSQVYKMIAEYEGKETNGKDVYFDDVKIDEKGDWIVNYRNDKGELLGKYMEQKGKVKKIEVK